MKLFLPKLLITINMSILICLDTLTEQSVNIIEKQIEVKKKKNRKYNMFQPNEYIYPYRMNDKFIFLPLNYVVTKYDTTQQPKLLKQLYEPCNIKFKGKLRPIQKTIKKEAIQMLNKQHTTIIAAYTGCGKTITSIYLACKIKLKTLIIINRIILMKQWVNSIKKVVPDAIIQTLTSKSEIDKSADFYIINAINVEKHSYDDFKHIGTLIVDEVHLIATKVLSKSLGYITPKYSIALSATPTRSDGLDKLIHLYFGTNIIYKKLNKKHIVYKVNTKFKPKHKLNQSGRVDWDSVLSSQATDSKRNQLIVDIVKQYKERVFLILCKRIVQAKLLLKLFEQQSIDVTYLCGSAKEFKVNARVLIATIQKCGTGFDHPRLDSLILAADVKEYFIQYLGRVMRREDVEPYVFDLVDDNSILKSHYYSRRKIYKEHGGIFKQFKIN